MRENTDQEKLRIWTLFTQYFLMIICKYFQSKYYDSLRAAASGSPRQLLIRQAILLKLFRKTASPHAYNCTKKVTISGVFFVESFQFNLHIISRLFCKKNQMNSRFYLQKQSSGDALQKWCS